MSHYGKGMRDCCDSPAQQGQRHIVGCRYHSPPEPFTQAEGRAMQHGDTVSKIVLDDYSLISLTDVGFWTNREACRTAARSMKALNRLEPWLPRPIGIIHVRKKP